MKNKLLFFILIIICSIPALWGIIHPGLFVSDDGSWMVIRLSAFYQALSSGQIPVRFLPRLNEGLGYPVADFLYPLFLYVGSILHIIKIPFLIDVKLLFAGSFVLSGIGSYLFLQKHFSKISAFFGSLFYLYLPYHLYDLYNRGSLGEVLSLAIVPYLLWAVDMNWILASVGIGLLILAHNTLALFFLPVVLIYAVIQKMSIQKIIAMCFLGLGLAAFFWIPALYDKQFTIFDSVAVSHPALYFVDKISFTLVGWIAIAIFGGIILLRFSWKEKVVTYFFLLGIISFFFSISLSSIVWQSKFLAQFVQFPFRFLSLLLLSESFLAAYCIQKLKAKPLPVIFFILLLFFSSVPYITPKQYDYQMESFYTTNVATTTVGNEYMPIWAKQMPTSYVYQRVFVNKNEGVVTNIEEKGTKLSFTINTNKQTEVQIGNVYFPGWKVQINGKDAAVSPSKDSGLIQFSVPKGTYSVRAFYTETKVNLLADLLSIVSLLIIIAIVVRKKYEK